jgi:hypothetical protein
MAVRRADAAPDDPYLLAFDDTDLEDLVGRDAPLELRREALERSLRGVTPIGKKTPDEPDALILARPQAS